MSAGEHDRGNGAQDTQKARPPDTLPSLDGR